METCKICNLELSENKNALSLHLFNSHKDVSKHEYYDSYLGTKGICFCGNDTKFANIRLGYKKYCSNSCATKASWVGDEERKELGRKIIANNGNKDGRPKGSKNKNPYPASEAVMARMQHLHDYLKSINHYSERNYKFWNSTEPEIVEKQKYVLDCFMKSRFVDDTQALPLISLDCESLNKVFGIE